MSGCDTTSALFRRGKTFAFKVIDNDRDLSYLEVFKLKTSTYQEIASAGEKFLLNMYNAPKSTETLDDLRFMFYKKQVNKTLTSKTGFELKSLPPSSDSAKYHSFRVYYQIQKWLGNDQINPTDWGWVKKEHLIPLVKDKAAAPDKILRIISCGCKHGCSDKSCVCVKAGMVCTILCSGCNGRDCNNCENVMSYPI